MHAWGQQGCTSSLPVTCQYFVRRTFCLTTGRRPVICISIGSGLANHGLVMIAQRVQPSAASLSIPVFIGHGTLDQLIPSSMASNSEQTLQRLGDALEFVTRTGPRCGSEACFMVI